MILRGPSPRDAGIWSGLLTLLFHCLRTKEHCEVVSQTVVELRLEGLSTAIGSGHDTDTLRVESC